jgi:hypothetical protein
MHRTKGVKVPVWPAALKVQVAWIMIKMFDDQLMWTLFFKEQWWISYVPLANIVD